MTTVITYQLAYLAHRRVDLCAACVEADDHGRGSLGPVSHGAHRGECGGANHSAHRARAVLTTYAIATDSSSETIDAASADEAARRFARSEGLRGVKTADDLRRAVERAGGYGSMSDADGEIWHVAR